MREVYLRYDHKKQKKETEKKEKKDKPSSKAYEKCTK